MRKPGASAVLDKRKIIARTKFFAGLDDAVLTKIADAAVEQTFAAKQMIFLRGDPGNAIYIVLRGRVRLSILAADGRELSFTHAEPGDVFGEIAVIDRAPRSADATALSDVHALVLSATDIEALIDRFPAIAWSVMKFLCARLRDTSDHLEHIALLPLEVRLARYLLARVLPPVAPPGGAGLRLDLSMSQTELALLLGASRQKVNVALASLEQTGAIRRADGAYVCSPGRLKEAARFE